MTKVLEKGYRPRPNDCDVLIRFMSKARASRARLGKKAYLGLTRI